MSNDHPPQHSGSRWEPATGSDPSGGLAGRPPVSGADTSAETGTDSTGGSSGDRKSRRRRGPLLAVLAAVLTLGASTAGIAYVQAAQEPRSNEPAAAAGDAPSTAGEDRGNRGEQSGPVGSRPGDDGDGDGDRHHDHDDDSGQGSSGHDDAGHDDAEQPS